MKLIVRSKMSKKMQQLLIFFSLFIAALVPLSTCQPPNQLVVVTDDNCYMKTNSVLDKLNTCERQKWQDDSNRTNQLWTDEVKQTISAMMKQQQQESKSQLDQVTSKLEKVDEMLRKMENQSQVEKIEATLELVKMQVQQNAHLIKLPAECQRWLRTQNLNRTHFFSAEGNYFYFNKTIKVNWNAARDWCAERGMKMAMLKTKSQMDAVAKELKERTAGGNYWVGASDVGQPAGEFRWADGTLVDATTWANGKIYKTNSDLNERTCVDFGTEYVNLTDDKCSFTSPILCQLPPSLAACL